MSEVIKVEAIGKQYRLRSRREVDLNGRITDLVGRAIRSAFTRQRPESSTIWAVRNVSFAVAEGQVVGIVGRNGAGKSTLMRLLSRITQPTEGYAEIHGRVGSLLEVGVGFHPELTGRENIYLNGTIMGMSRAEVKKKLDAIVAFAGVEEFLDMPVKRYSSGMYVRLAFAVAAHLEPDILIVDEVLAVGDARFQKACIEKMQQVTREGRTILFVSHNLALLSQLCTRGLYLDEGRLLLDGPIDEVVSAYLAQNIDCLPTDLERCRHIGAGEHVRFTEIRMPTGPALPFGEPLILRCALECDRDYPDLSLGATIISYLGEPVATAVAQQTFAMRRGQSRAVEFRLNNFNLAPGRYHAVVSVGVGGIHSRRTNLDLIYGVPHFEVLPSSSRFQPVAEWHRNMGNLAIIDNEVRLLDEAALDSLSGSA